MMLVALTIIIIRHGVVVPEGSVILLKLQAQQQFQARDREGRVKYAGHGDPLDRAHPFRPHREDHQQGPRTSRIRPPTQFIRDLMVLGQEDILKRVEKLIPQLTKICSHELGSTDPDRGETYFHSHPCTCFLTQCISKPRSRTKSKSKPTAPPISSYLCSPYCIGRFGCLWTPTASPPFTPKPTKL